MFRPIRDEFYAERRWTIRFCILSMTMLLCQSSSLSAVYIFSNKNYSLMELLLIICPFFAHSLQLLHSVILLRSSRKDSQYLDKCRRYIWISNLASPTIILEGILLSNYWKPLLILLSLSPYVIAIVKFSNVMNKFICTSTQREQQPTVTATAESPRNENTIIAQPQHPANMSQLTGTTDSPLANFVIVAHNIVIFGVEVELDQSDEDEDSEKYESSSPPSYNEAMRERTPDLPPHYTDVMGW